MSRTILHIDSSARREGSTSRELGRRFIARWKQHHPEDRVVERDLGAAPLPHLDETLLAAFFTPAEQHAPAVTEAATRADALIDELFAADVVVIGAPMYNFGVPSTLKAYIDHIARAGRTFRYGERGPEGLVLPFTHKSAISAPRKCQAKARCAANGDPLASAATRAWRFRGAPCG